LERRLARTWLGADHDPEGHAGSGNPTEQVFAEALAGIVDVDRVSVDSDFFADLGGAVRRIDPPRQRGWTGQSAPGGTPWRPRGLRRAGTKERSADTA
jgi:hypothetical protein